VYAEIVGVLRLAAWLVVASCGRVGFDVVPQLDSRPDAQVVPRVLSTNSGTTTGADAPTLTVPLPATNGGDMLVVAVTSHDGIAVTGVTDGNGHAFTSANVRAAEGGVASEIWYETAAPSTTQVTVDFVSKTSVDAFVFELSGVSGPPALTAMSCVQYPPAIATAPITTTVPNQVIVTATMFAFPLFVASMDPPFVGLAPVTGNDAGYLVADTPGTYASTFQIASGQGMAAMTCASSVAWPPS